MEKKTNIELTFDEYAIVFGGIALMQRELYKAAYETMNGDREKRDSISIDEFDRQHGILRGLYDKFGEAAKKFEEKK